MIGKPKVGEVWVVDAVGVDETFWRYHIVAIINHRGNKFYIGAKAFGDVPYVLTFGQNGLCVTDGLEGIYKLGIRSKSKPKIELLTE